MYFEDNVSIILYHQSNVGQMADQTEKECNMQHEYSILIKSFFLI